MGMTVSSGVTFDVPIENQTFDTANMFDPSLGEIEIPKTGYYKLGVRGSFESINANSDHSKIEWYVVSGIAILNQYSLESHHAGGAMYKKLSNEILIQANAGAKLRVRGYQDSGSNKTFRRGMTRVYGFYVGGL